MTEILMDQLYDHELYYFISLGGETGDQAKAELSRRIDEHQAQVVNEDLPASSEYVDEAYYGPNYTYRPIESYRPPLIERMRYWSSVHQDIVAMAFILIIALIIAVLIGV